MLLFDDIIKLEDFILIDEKSHKNVLICDISYKTLIGASPLHVRFDKLDGFIRIYDRTRYLTLFSSEKQDAIYNKIRYPISLKISITYVFSHYYTKIVVDSYDSLHTEKRLTLHVIILIRSVLNKDKNHYYYDIFLEKCFYQLTKK